MKLIDCFYQDGVIDCWTIVLNEEDPNERYYLMIAANEDGRNFFQFTEGYYDPVGENTHLGQRPRVISERLLNQILERISDE